MARRVVIGVMGAGENARAIDIRNAFALGSAIANEGWVVVTGGRNRGVMDAVNKGAKASGGLTVGILSTKDRRTISVAVDVAITRTWAAHETISMSLQAMSSLHAARAEP